MAKCSTRVSGKRNWKISMADHMSIFYIIDVSSILTGKALSTQNILRFLKNGHMISHRNFQISFPANASRAFSHVYDRQEIRSLIFA